MNQKQARALIIYCLLMRTINVEKFHRNFAATEKQSNVDILTWS